MLANTCCVFSGQTLTIEAKGTLKEEVKKGAYALLEVKYGLITLIRQTVDLCDQIKNVALECPLKKGDMTLTKEVELPKQIPPVSDVLSVLLDTWGEGNDHYVLMLCTRASTMSTPMCTIPMRRISLASRLMILSSTLVDSSCSSSHI